MITAIPGVAVGHWSDERAQTGCTVVVLPPGTVASGEVRGGAPGTREWALLDPGASVNRVDAVVLTGGSAFGLAACEGVVEWCEEHGRGWPTPAGAVPIVVGMVIYDLSVGDPKVRPGRKEGYAAAADAKTGPVALARGRVGAGTGATVGKWRGPGAARPSGLGSAWVRRGDLLVAALMVVNALGDPVDWDRRANADTKIADSDRAGHVGPATGRPRIWDPSGGQAGVESTSIGVVVTNARLDKLGCRKAAEAGHDGLARALEPVHTAADGDALVVAATGTVQAPLPVLQGLAAWVVERAVADAVAYDGEPVEGQRESLGG